MIDLTSQGQDPATPAFARDTAEELVGPIILCFSLAMVKDFIGEN